MLVLQTMTPMSNQYVVSSWSGCYTKFSKRRPDSEARIPSHYLQLRRSPPFPTLFFPLIQ